MDYLLSLDTNLLLAVNSHHSLYFDYVMKAATGKMVWTLFYMSLLFCVVRSLPYRQAFTVVIGIALTILLADQIGASVIRPAVMRMRPSCADNPISEFIHLVDGYRGRRYGFPSCHAANAFGVMAFMCMVFRSRTLFITLALWSLLLCYSRLYLGVHYPGDLLAGALLGTCVGILVALGVRRLGRDWRLDKGSPRIIAGVFAATCLFLLGYGAWRCLP